MKECKTVFLLICIWCILIDQISCGNSVNVVGQLPNVVFQCLKSQGYSKVIQFLQPVTATSIDTDGVQSMKTAKIVGMNVEFLYHPCRSQSAKSQVQLIMKKIESSLYSRLWIAPSHDKYQCIWQNYSAEENCQYIKNFYEEAAKYGKSVGVSTSYGIWQKAFKKQSECSEINYMPLFWQCDSSEIDKQPNFDSYHQIGGWKLPELKLYTLKVMCGIITSLNYYA